MFRLDSCRVGLDVVQDTKGSVEFGWIESGVFYVRLSGALSADVGLAFVRRLEEAVLRVPSLRYFSDARDLKVYDLIARSAFVRLVLAERRRFSDLVMLTWAGGVTASTEAFRAAIGGPSTILTEAAEFERLLARAAPLASQVIESKVRSGAVPLGSGQVRR